MDFPLVVRGNPVLTTPHTHIETILRPQDWQHKIDARGGFLTASFSMFGPRHYLENWFDRALGRMITRYDNHWNVIWEGYVHSATLTLPEIQYSQTLENLANYVLCQYTPTNWGDHTTSTATNTSAAQDTDSQNLYGLAYHQAQGGEMTVTQANAMRDIHYAKYRRPARQVRDAPGEPRLTLELRGYSNWFRKRPYGQITTLGTSNASKVVTDILDSATGSITIGQYVYSRQVDLNTFQIQNWFTFTPLAWSWDIFNKICDQGDGTNRYNWGIYENRTFYYRAIPTVVKYLRRYTDGRVAILDQFSRVIPPWEMRPDNFIRLLDTTALDRPVTTDFVTDPTIQYIQSVEWREDDPFTANIQYLEADSLASTIVAGTYDGARL